MAYSDAEVTEAMILLAVNKYDWDKTAEQFGVSTKTLRLWNKNFQEKSVPELLNRAIQRMLMVIPSTMTGKDWGITMGILMDKWLIMQGQPTSRVENLVSALENMSNEDLKELEQEFIKHASVEGSDADKS